MTNRRQPVDRRQGNDRRDTTRQKSDASLRLLRAGSSADMVLQGELLDVSPTGIRLLVKERLLHGERILVELKDAEQGCLNLAAEVVWQEADPNELHRVGCELRMEMTRSQRSLMQRFVTATSRK